MTFKEKFMAALEMAGITFDEFVEETGYNRKTVLNWLGQNQKPRVLSEICKMLDLEEDYFDECFEECRWRRGGGKRHEGR